MRLQNFQRLAEELPLERTLTETDAPYMGPSRGARNDPATIPGAVAAIAQVRGESFDDVANAIRVNFNDFLSL